MLFIFPLLSSSEESGSNRDVTKEEIDANSPSVEEEIEEKREFPCKKGDTEITFTWKKSSPCYLRIYGNEWSSLKRDFHGESAGECKDYPHKFVNLFIGMGYTCSFQGTIISLLEPVEN